MTLPEPPTRLSGHGLVLRPWEERDLPAMVTLFDEPAIALRTPLVSPFGLDAARTYLETAQRTRAERERLHLTLTTDGQEPLGEVLLSYVTGIMGYAVGSAHRGQRLAPRAMSLLVDHAHAVGLTRLRLEIEADNAASIAVARALDFQLSDSVPRQVEDKARTYLLHTWVHDARTPPDVNLPNATAQPSTTARPDATS